MVRLAVMFTYLLDLSRLHVSVFSVWRMWLHSVRLLLEYIIHRGRRLCVWLNRSPSHLSEFSKTYPLKMRSNTILASSALFVTYAAQASPLFERWGNETTANSTSFSNTTSTTPNATQILQFALTLEHLESTFYSEALSKFNETDFTNAGLPTYAYGRFKQIIYKR